MRELTDLRTRLKRAQDSGLEVNEVIMSPETWRRLHAEHVALTGTEIAPAELLGVPIRLNARFDRPSFVFGDAA